jgi:hypothetical protein
VLTTLAALEAIANHVTRIPGRKNLVWISGGFPLQMGLDEFTVSDTQEKRTFSEEMERTAKALNAPNLAVYPVDARGLMTDPGLSAAGHGNANPRKGPQMGADLSGRVQSRIRRIRWRPWRCARAGRRITTLTI